MIANAINTIEIGLENRNHGFEPVTAKALRIASSRLLAKIYVTVNSRRILII